MKILKKKLSSSYMWLINYILELFSRVFYKINASENHSKPAPFKYVP